MSGSLSNQSVPIDGSRSDQEMIQHLQEQLAVAKDKASEDVLVISRLNSEIARASRESTAAQLKTEQDMSELSLVHKSQYETLHAELLSAQQKASEDVAVIHMLTSSIDRSHEQQVAAQQKAVQDLRDQASTHKLQYDVLQAELKELTEKAIRDHAAYKHTLDGQEQQYHVLIQQHESDLKAALDGQIAIQAELSVAQQNEAKAKAELLANNHLHAIKVAAMEKRIEQYQVNLVSLNDTVLDMSRKFHAIETQLKAEVAASRTTIDQLKAEIEASIVDMANRDATNKRLLEEVIEARQSNDELEQEVKRLRLELDDVVRERNRLLKL